jgi:flavin reductase (DIM6/NTAB) family NADH-FMN oxidoreductase RutF
MTTGDKAKGGARKQSKAMPAAATAATPPGQTGDGASMDQAKFRNLMRHQAGAVTIIAVGEPGSRTGLTATAMCSLSDSPPSVLICVNKNASAHAPIKAMGTFSVNVLARDQEELARRFSTKKLEGEARFDADAWDTMSTGAPVLKNTIASLDCELSSEHEVDTHSIFVGFVRDGRFREDAEPLLYFRGDFWDLKDK